MNMWGSKKLFGFVSRVALSLLALAATQHGATAQTVLASALPAAGSSTSTVGIAATPGATLMAQMPAPTTSPVLTTTPTPMMVAQAPATPASCAGVSPYDNYSCLDAYLGDDFFTRLYNYYKLEWGQAGPPTDPNAPPGRTDGWPRTPETTPPISFTEWPTGALTSIGVTRPNGADSPFMAAISNTGFGQFLLDNHFQIYGWVNPGMNLSTNSNKPGGNGPIPYTYTPNTVQLDQAVIYLDRWPDTVQTDHFDWGMRLSAIYGENYRYTNSFGLLSYQFNGANNVYGYDLPMEYVDLYWPDVFGIPMEMRIGRYISIPDIEAQLAPNNYTYTHSLTYGWDNYTNTGIVTSWQVTKNILVQLGITDGTETPLWHLGQNRPNLMPGNALYPGKTYPTDPGSTPSATACVRFVWNDGYDTFYPCLDGINGGQWGYNNVQWHGFTYYHKFNDQWHIAYENYYLSESDVPNLRNPAALAIFNGGGTPFSPQNLNYNPPNLAYCNSTMALKCDVSAIGVLAYINYTPDPLNNFSFRPEFYYDPNGWRTGTGGYTRYVEFTASWQHWLSPQIEFRPELSYWHSFSTPAFNGEPNAGIPANRKDTFEFASDMIFHF